MPYRWQALAAALAGALTLAGPAGAGQDIRVGAVADYVEANIRPWLASPVIIDAILAQNARHSRLNQAQIQDLDTRWRAELSGGPQPLIEATLSNPLSSYLRRRQRAAEGLITEIFVMDNRGLNVGQSDVTSDYWQGDEAKWLRSFGAGRLHIEAAARDESTQLMQSQASLPIRDPQTGAIIGAITIGINLDAL